MYCGIFASSIGIQHCDRGHAAGPFRRTTRLRFDILHPSRLKGQPRRGAVFTIAAVAPWRRLHDRCRRAVAGLGWAAAATAQSADVITGA
jgi:hypothetical protein